MEDGTGGGTRFDGGRGDGGGAGALARERALAGRGNLAYFWRRAAPGRCLRMEGGGGTSLSAGCPVAGSQGQPHGAPRTDAGVEQPGAFCRGRLAGKCGRRAASWRCFFPPLRSPPLGVAAPSPPRSRPPTLGTTEAKFRVFGPVTCRGGSPVLPYCRLVGRLRPSVGRLGWQPTALGQRLLPSSPWPPPLRGVPDWWCKSCSAWGGSVRGSRLCSRWITLNMYLMGGVRIDLRVRPRCGFD